MAEYFRPHEAPKWVDCPHRVDLPHYAGVDLTDEIEAWMRDPSRPGHWNWGENRTRSNDDPRLTYWSLYISDPDVAFEAKVRWG